MSRASLLLSIASFGYALPWVALGSLLAYFKHHGGDQYYVAIYCCYYAPGLPIAILQTHFDSSYDMKYSSRVTFAVRGLLCWSLTLVIIPLLRVHLLVPEVCLPLVGALGVSTWSLHGSASQLASLVPGDGGVCAQQIGFALPAAVTFAVLEGFDMGGGEETSSQLDIFFFLIFCFVAIGSLAWWKILQLPEIIASFLSKDETNIEGNGGYSSPNDEPLNLPKSRRVTRAEVASMVAPALHAQFLTMFVSVFAAGFFTYVPGEGSRSISTTLYFVRLGADLALRPFASLGKFHRVNSMERLRIVSVARIILLVIFILYIFWTGFPTCNFFIIVLCLFLFGSSGFLSILSYSLACESLGDNSAARAYCGALINEAFQKSIFVAVLCSEGTALALGR